MLLPARIVRLYRLRDNRAGRISPLEILALRRNRPRHVATHKTDADRGDNHNSFHNVKDRFWNSAAKIMRH